MSDFIFQTTADSKCDELQDLLTHSTSQCTKLEEGVASLQGSLDQLTQEHKSMTDELALYKSQLAGAQKMLQQKEADIEVYGNSKINLSLLIKPVRLGNLVAHN